MRVLRCADELDLELCVRQAPNDVLPILFCAEDASRIARTVSRELAELVVAAFLDVDTTLMGGPGDWVLAPPSGVESDLARRYARITGRQVLAADVPAAVTTFTHSAPHSITWICPLDDVDMAASLHSMYGLLDSGGDNPRSRIGVLTAESLTHLSWVLVRQALGPIDAIGHTTLLSARPSPVPTSLMRLSADHSSQEIIEGLTAARGTVLVNAHSRPHCGVLPAADGQLGMCGLDDGGADGRCVNGVACTFGTSPRVVLSELAASRLYFNGCTTAGHGSLRRDYLPRQAMIAHAVVRGGAREYVGNVCAGHFDDSDLHWFLGASALGYTPAQCVEIVAAARLASGRGGVRSLTYFGDAMNPAWPVEGVTVGVVTPWASGLFLRWPQTEQVMIAKLVGQRWAELGRDGRLCAHSRHDSDPSVAVVEDPFDHASLVLAVPRRASGPGGVEVVLSALERPLPHDGGQVLASAVRNLRWLAALPAFEQVLANATKELDRELLAVRRACAAGADLTAAPRVLEWVRHAEAETAQRFDTAIIDVALTCTEGYWNWQKEYTDHVQASPRPSPTACPVCAGHAIEVDYTDWLEPAVARVGTVCGFCGVVSDVPAGWPLPARFVPATLLSRGIEGVAFSVEITNTDDRPHRIVLGVGIERGGPLDDPSAARATLELEPGRTELADFTLTTVRPLTELLQVRLYVACEAAFAVHSVFLLFGRQP